MSKLTTAGPSFGTLLKTSLNETREAAGAAPLVWEPELMPFAKRMAQSVKSEDGQPFIQWYRRQGHAAYHKLGVLVHRLPQNSEPGDFIRDWFHDGPNRAVLLNNDYTCFGVETYHHKGLRYIALILATPGSGFFEAQIPKMPARHQKPALPTTEGPAANPTQANPTGLRITAPADISPEELYALIAEAMEGLPRE